MAKRKLFKKFNLRLRRFSIKRVLIFILGVIVVAMVSVFVMGERFSADSNGELVNSGKKAKLTVKVVELDGKTVVPNTSVQFLGKLTKYSESYKKYSLDNAKSKPPIIVGHNNTDSKGLASFDVSICTRNGKKILCSYDKAEMGDQLYELSRITPSVLNNGEERRYFSGSTTHDATITVRLKTISDLCL